MVKRIIKNKYPKKTNPLFTLVRMWGRPSVKDVIKSKKMMTDNKFKLLIFDNLNKIECKTLKKIGKRIKVPNPEYKIKIPKIPGATPI